MVLAEICLQNTMKSFGKTKVLEPLDLTVKNGEFLVLVGPSGCGKSTLLRLIAGLEQPSGGDILIEGRSALGIEPKNRNLAMVFQSYALYPHMTVAENMGLALKIKKMNSKEIEKEVSRVAAILGLGQLLDRKPGALSGGQRQRVAMGRAIVRKPRAFLFDEPLSNLDASLRLKVRTEIKKLHQSLGTTTIYVTHDQTEAMTLADRIVVMNAGVIQQLGTPMEIFNQPANEFVAGFMGSPKMNFLNINETSEGRLIWDNGVEIAVPLADALAKGMTSSLRLGIRPEHINLEPAADRILLGQGRIIVKEPLGTEVLLEIEFQGQELTLKTPWRDSFMENQKLDLHVSWEQLHFFDGEMGEAISPVSIHHHH